MRQIQSNATANSRSAIEKGSNELKVALKIAAPKSVSILSKTLPTKKRGFGVSVYATVFTKKNSNSGKGHFSIPRWFEFGTNERVTKKSPKSGQTRGKLRARPFFFPTYRAFKSRIGTRITRSVTQAFKDGQK